MSIRKVTTVELSPLDIKRKAIFIERHISCTPLVRTRLTQCFTTLTEACRYLNKIAPVDIHTVSRFKQFKADVTWHFPMSDTLYENVCAVVARSRKGLFETRFQRYRHRFDVPTHKLRFDRVPLFFNRKSFILLREDKTGSMSIDDRRFFVEIAWKEEDFDLIQDHFVTRAELILTIHSRFFLRMVLYKVS